MEHLLLGAGCKWRRIISGNQVCVRDIDFAAVVCVFGRRLNDIYGFSRMAVTPWPPAAQMEISPRPPPLSSSSLASVATILVPVAANGWPSAMDEPLTLSLSVSMAPSG